MKVLFVSSGNNGNINVLVENQAITLRVMGVEVDHFLILGKGLIGYFKNVPRIRKYLKKNRYDIIHAHYSLSAIATSLAGAKKMVVSLMGSDAYLNVWMKLAARFFYSFFWKETIVKTVEMKDSLKLKSAHVIPNGVDLNVFSPKNKLDCLKKLDWDINKKHIVFAANPNRKEKNFMLAQKAIHLLNPNQIELHCLKNIDFEEIPFYFNAADVVLLTSSWEGSPNVIKEAMACNCPIVATNVGDIYLNIRELDGCYTTTNNPRDVAQKVSLALSFNKRTNGRERINSLGLDSKTIAKKIYAVYSEVLNE